MRTAVRVALIVLASAAVAVAAWQGAREYQRRMNQRARAPEAARSLLVTCTPVKRGTVTRVAVLTGTVRPMAEVAVVPKVPGRLERLRLEDGTPVDEGLVIGKAGALIAVIDHDQLQADVDLAKAAVAVAQAAVTQAETVRKDAEREKRRIADLWKQGSATEQARDLADSAYERVAAAKLVAEASVAQAQAVLKRAEVLLQEAFIKAPIAGVVTRKWLDEGNMANPTSPIVTIQDTGTVKVLVGLNEEEAARIRPGQTQAVVTVYADGKVERTVPVQKVCVTSDVVTHTVEVELHLPNADRTLRPGTFARVALKVGEFKDAMVIPERSVIQEGGDKYVFVVKGDKAHRRSVTTGLSDGPWVQVLRGLDDAEAVVTDGQHLLADGDGVTVGPAARPGPAAATEPAKAPDKREQVPLSKGGTK